MCVLGSQGATSTEVSSEESKEWTGEVGGTDLEDLKGRWGTHTLP